MLKEYLEAKSNMIEKVELCRKALEKLEQDECEKTIEYLNSLAVKATNEEFSEFLRSEKITAIERIAVIMERTFSGNASK